MGCSLILLDQSYWQNAIAAKPIPGMFGFISAGVTALSIPVAFGTVVGLSYMSLLFQAGEPLLPTEDRCNYDSIIPIVEQCFFLFFICVYILVMTAYVTIRNAMGHTGEIMYMLLLIAATTTSMCAQVIGVSSIIVYDIYKTYLRVKE